MCPMLDDRNDTPSAHQMAELPMWNRQANEVGWTALLGEARGGPDVSPYASRIWQAGGVAELHVWPGGYHGFDPIAPHAALSKAAVAARADWLRRVIGGRPLPTRHS